ncbi:unnamed protein product [Cylindrotheca closterium]|uniref:Helicase-associated domain-containing protein n=1 Tax=Cylindrotheca closterium TaxID=2856 RepID=A0AAD2CKR4_9STRA|nr:unnamed protein product [Cylindrotheca closterium]
MYGAENNNLRSDSYSYSNIEDEELLSLLRSPFLPLDAPKVSPSPSHPHRMPFSFHDIFDDASMEPSPLKSQAPVTANWPQMQPRYDASLLIDESIVSEEDNMSNDTNKKIGPTIDPTSVGSKRSLGDCSSNNDEGSFSVVTSSKRSRKGFFLSSNHNHQEGDPCNKRQRTTTSTAKSRPCQDEQWRAQFQKLIQYKMKHGDCSVPHSYQEDPALARWVKRQRYQYKKIHDNHPTSTMTTRRIEETTRRFQELESIGFIWESHVMWQEKLYELKAFKEKMGHCNVPSHNPENVGLSAWANCQRRQYKLHKSRSSASSDMAIHRFQVLESMGFVLAPQQVCTQLMKGI